jgi:hypothetical protein
MSEAISTILDTSQTNEINTSENNLSIAASSFTPDKLILISNVAYVAGEAKPGAYNNGKPVETLKPKELATFEAKTEVGYAYVATCASSSHLPQDAAGVVNVTAGRTIACINDGITGLDPNSGKILGHKSGALARRALEMLGEYNPAQGSLRGYLRDVVRVDLGQEMDAVGDMHSDTLMQLADIKRSESGAYDVDFYYVGRAKDLGYSFIVPPREGLIQDFVQHREENAGILADEKVTRTTHTNIQPGSVLVLCSDGFKKKIPPEDKLGYLRRVYDGRERPATNDDASFVAIGLD